jgi:hypothetical protein
MVDVPLRIKPVRGEGVAVPLRIKPVRREGIAVPLRFKPMRGRRSTVYSAILFRIKQVPL